MFVFACFYKFTLHQMDVKSEILNRYIKVQVYVKQPLGFEDPKGPNHVYKLNKALYGLKQAPIAWYERLNKFLISQGFSRVRIDTTLFTKGTKDKFLVVQVYVDDIIFGSKYTKLYGEFAYLMGKEFKMSMMGELNFFLSLQIKQSKEENFINQSKYKLSSSRNLYWKMLKTPRYL